jgi:integrase
MKITIVYDNEANAGLKSGWGFSCLIEAKEKILFDTGDSGKKLIYNMKQLNIVPETIDKVVNPFDALRFKKPATRRWHRITIAEYHALLEAAPTLRWKAFYALAYTSGARVSELFSLTWNDVDFGSGKLIIADREGTASMPPFHVKDHEARSIPLPTHTIDFLTQLQSQATEGIPYILLEKERYERVKTKWQELRKERKPWLNRYMVNNVLRDFKSHCKRAGIKPVGKLTIHTLRKSAGQNWADHPPMNVVKELMGHSKAETTL